MNSQALKSRFDMPTLLLTLRMGLTAHQVPEQWHPMVMRYLANGILRPESVGSEIEYEVLRAVVENDLRGAFLVAPPALLDRVPNLVAFFINVAPTLAWGSPLVMRTWLTMGGLLGLTETDRSRTVLQPLAVLRGGGVLVPGVTSG